MRLDIHNQVIKLVINNEAYTSHIIAHINTIFGKPWSDCGIVLFAPPVVVGGAGGGAQGTANSRIRIGISSLVVSTHFGTQVVNAYVWLIFKDYILWLS
jgi:hypothetical protein